MLHFALCYAFFAAALCPDGSVLTTGLSRLAAKYPNLDGNGTVVCMIDTGLQYKLPAVGSCHTDNRCCCLALSCAFFAAALCPDGSVLTTGLSRLATKYPNLDGNGKLICVVNTGLQYRLSAFGSRHTENNICCCLPCHVLLSMVCFPQMGLCLPLAYHGSQPNIPTWMATGLSFA
jgi:hypothetical protein